MHQNKSLWQGHIFLLMQSHPQVYEYAGALKTVRNVTKVGPRGDDEIIIL